MSVASTSVAMAAKVKPHAKLLLIYISESLDEYGNFRRAFLDNAREWTGMTEPQFERALLHLRQEGWYEDATDEGGYPCLRFKRMSDIVLSPQFYSERQREKAHVV